MTKYKEPPGRDRIASQPECLRLLEECAKSRNEHLLLIVLLAITTGMRQGEITGLTWDCVNLEKGQINLRETKNGRSRTIAVVGEALRLLREHYLARAKHTDLVFPAKKRFGKPSIRKAWEEVRKRAQLDGLRFHDLRHTFATFAAESGASTLELATAMGHETLQMLQRYTHLNTSTQQRLSTAVHNRILEVNHAQDQTPKAS